MADINQQILAALEEGHSPDVILQAIKQRANDSPAHAAWYKNFQNQSLDARSQQNDVDTYPDMTNPQDVRTAPNQSVPNAPSSNTTQQNQTIASRISQHLAETSGPQLAGEAAGGVAALELGRRAIANIVPTPGERVQKEQNRLREQELELQRQKVASGTTLSPYEQARADTEKLRAQQIQQQIEIEAKQFELNKAKAEQAQAAAKQREAAKTQIKDPVEQRLAEISKSQGYGGNIAPAGNTVPQVNTMQPQPAPPPPAPTAVAPIERYVFTAEGLQKANPGQTEWEIGNKTFDAQEYADYLNDKFKSALESKTPTSAAEVPKTPLIVEAPAPATPAPPPAEVPQAAVPPTEEKLTKQQKGMKGHLVAMYGGGHEGEAAYGKVKEILGYTPEYPPGKGGSLSAQETQILKDWRKANMAGPKINLTHDMKKAMTSGTTLAVLMSIPAFAEAAQNKNYGEMTNIATDLLVLPFAQSRATGENEQYELAKRRYEGMVGGGRGVTPAQAYNVGAGRGVAPPSAYQR